MRRRTEKSSTIIKKKYHPSSRRYIYETITFEDVKIAGKNMIGRFLLIFRFQLSVLGKHLNFSFRQFDNQELNIRRKKNKCYGYFAQFYSTKRNFIFSERRGNYLMKNSISVRDRIKISLDSQIHGIFVLCAHSAPFVKQYFNSLNRSWFPFENARLEVLACYQRKTK